MTRQYTNTLLDMLNNGVMSSESLVRLLLGYMSEDDVKDFMWQNSLVLSSDDNLEDGDVEEDDDFEPFILSYELVDELETVTVTVHCDTSDEADAAFEEMRDRCGLRHPYSID